MKTFGNKQRLCLGAWLIAALLLVWLNGLSFLSIENQPLGSDSPTIRSLRLKLSRLENVVAGKAQKFPDQDDARGLFAAYQPPQRQTSANGLPPADGMVAPEGEDQIQLPVLTGIVKVSDLTQAPSYLAVLGGRVCRVQDRVQEFTIAKISAEGVALHRLGKQWFIASPKPNYTSDQGR